jgi:DNA-binding transcriptional ArsR family regulator
MTRVRRLDAASLRVLAHPLRVRIVGSLRVDGPATATLLGTRLGESSGLTSYHLRTLAAAGFVEDAVDHPATGRERWWRAVDDMTSWRPSDAGDDPDSRAAEQWLAGFTAREAMGWLDDWLQRRPDAEPAWREASEANDYLLHATPDELRDLLSELDAVVRRRLGVAGASDRVPVRLLLSAFPAGPVAAGPAAGSTARTTAEAATEARDTPAEPAPPPPRTGGDQRGARRAGGEHAGDTGANHGSDADGGRRP